MGARWSTKPIMPRRHEDSNLKLKIKTLCLGAFVALSQPGCMSVGSLVKELAHDPATVSVQVMTPYGSLKFVRTNPSTNQSVVVDPTGVITIKP